MITEGKDMKAEFSQDTALDAVICLHAVTKTEAMPPGSRHYAQLICANCGAPLRYLPKPENAARWKSNEIKLARLQAIPDLKPWEREFINGLLRKGGRFNPKEQIAFNALCATYLQRKSYDNTNRNGVARYNHAA
jgi:hypothetical protein